ncbi:MAG: type II toxin-antitoxin system PemK/MazF family toxin [Methylobacteriaceae bacterium]|nr:type II toxin-antitoxin system PemK/MazF family toxin [Methylobacteriaceae bacterium]
MTSYFPAAGDIVWTDFDPTVGREQAGRRPALVLSTRELSENAGFVIVAPITSRVRPFPTSVVLPKGVAIEGEILLHQIRSLDMLARPIRFSGSRIPENAAVEVRTKLGLMIVV